MGSCGVVELRGLSSQTWQRLGQETVSGKNGNATGKLSELTGKPWGFVHGRNLVFFA